MAHGPCALALPNEYRENHSGIGTFEGALCLGGAWDDMKENCVGGTLYSGSFDFISRGHVKPAPLPEETFRGRLVILQGYGELAGLHGVLDLHGRAGPVIEYSGQIHIDPQ